MLPRTTTFLLSTLIASSLALADGIETGIELFESKRLEGAKQFFTEFTSANPRNPVGFFYLGRVCFAQEHFKAAERAYKQAVSLDDENSAYHHRLGQLYVAKIQTASIFKKLSVAKKARKHLERAVALDSSNVAARQGLFGYYLNAPGIAGGSGEQALQQAQAILELHEAKGRFALAQIYVKRKQDRLAEEEYRLAEKAIGDNPDHYNFYNSFGYFLLGQKKYEEAIVRFEKQVALAPDQVNSYDSLGDGYRAAGRLEQARDAYLKALAIDPEFKFSKENLKKVEKELRRSAK